MYFTAKITVKTYESLSRNNPKHIDVTITVDWNRNYRAIRTFVVGLEKGIFFKAHMKEIWASLCLVLSLSVGEPLTL